MSKRTKTKYGLITYTTFSSPKAIKRKTAFLLLLCLMLPMLTGCNDSEKAKERQEKLLQASSILDNYTISLILYPEENSLAIKEELEYVNRSSETQDHLLFRTWANAYADSETSPAAIDEIALETYGEAFSAGGIRVDAVWVNGELTEAKYDDGAKTCLNVPIPALAPGEGCRVLLHAAVTIPECNWYFGVQQDTFYLADCVPMLSVWEDGNWRCDEYYPIGDSRINTCANVNVQFSAPEGYRVYANMPLTDKEGVWQGEGLALRRVAFVVTKQLKEKTTVMDGCRITALAETEKQADAALDAVKQTITYYEKAYAVYPYSSYLVTSCSMPIESHSETALDMIACSQYDNEITLKQTIAFAATHQWFSGLVGVDEFSSPWMDEALSRWAQLKCVEKTIGSAQAELLLQETITQSEKENLHGTYTPGMPVDYFSDLTTYITVVYNRGAALAQALDMILDGGMNAFLRDYCEQFAFAIADRNDFERYLAVWSGHDLKALVNDYLDTLR